MLNESRQQMLHKIYSTGLDFCLQCIPTDPFHTKKAQTENSLPRVAGNENNLQQSWIRNQEGATSLLRILSPARGTPWASSCHILLSPHRGAAPASISPSHLLNSCSAQRILPEPAMTSPGRWGILEQTPLVLLASAFFTQVPGLVNRLCSGCKEQAGLYIPAWVTNSAFLL